MDDVCLPSGKRLKDLKVVTLQKELGKRRLSKVGKKAELIERLAESLLSEQGNNVTDNVDDTTSIVEVSPSEDTRRTSSSRIKAGRRVSKLNQQVTEDVEEDSMEITPKSVKSASSKSKTPAQYMNVTPIVKRRTPNQTSCLSSSEKSITHSVFKKRGSISTPKSAQSIKSIDGSEKDKKSPLLKSADRNVGRNSMNKLADTIAEFLSDDEDFVAAKKQDCMDIDKIAEANGKTPVTSAKRLGLLNSKNNLAAKTSGKLLLGPLVDASPALAGNSNKKISINKTPIRRLSKKLDITNNSVAASPGRRISKKLDTSVSSLGVSPASKSIKKKEGSSSSRFLMQHTKEFAKMESISEHQDKLKARHQLLTAKVPDVVKRLATPKSVKVSRSKVVRKGTQSETKLFNLDPLKKIDMNSFKFGSVAPDQISTVQKEYVKSAQMPVKNIKKNEMKADVKQLTKTMKLTIPVQNSRIDLLSTPKHKEIETKSFRRGYTPHKGAVKFMDTSKLTDEEFAIAVKSGIIPKGSRQVAEYNRNIRKDQILDIRRKLKL